MVIWISGDVVLQDLTPSLLLACPEETRREYSIELVDLNAVKSVDAVVWAVTHQVFAQITPARLAKLGCNGTGCGVVVDVKSVLVRAEVEEQGLTYWCL